VGSKRTPGKWEINPDDPYEIVDENGDVIAWVCNEPAENEALMAMSRAHAAHIVQACNAYDALVAACKGLIRDVQGLQIGSQFYQPTSVSAGWAAIAKAEETQ